MERLSENSWRARPHDKANKTKERDSYSFLLPEIYLAWQGWAEGFQTLDDLQSVNLVADDEIKIKELLSGEAADDEEATC